MSITGSTVLSLRVWSFSGKSLIIPRAGSTGMEVNRADTSYELRNFTGSSDNCLTCSTKSWVLLIWHGDLPTKGFRNLGKLFCHTIGD